MQGVPSIWPTTAVNGGATYSPAAVFGFIGPIRPASHSGNRYIVTLVDYFARYMFAHTVPHATGAAVRELLETVDDLLGWLLSIFTDNGPHFTRKEFHGLLENRCIRHFPALKSHPQSVGLAE